MIPLALMQATQPTDSDNGCLTIIVTWAPFVIFLGIWLLYMHRMGYLSKRGGYVKRSEDHMDRVEQTLSKIEEHLRKLSERESK